MKFGWRRECCRGIFSIGEINSIEELNPVDYVEEIIFDGDWKFIGCTEEVFIVCWGNDQTSLYARGPTGGDDHVNCWKMPQFLSEGILDSLGNISLLRMSL